MKGNTVVSVCGSLALPLAHNNSIYQMRISSFASKYSRSMDTTTALEHYKSPTSARSGRAENLISNVNFLLLKNLKRIWGASEKLIPTGPNQFKPQSLKLLFPKAKSCFSLAGREPLTFAAKQSFTRSMLKCKSAPSNWSCVSNTPFPHLHLLENSSKGFHKYLHIKCLCSDFSNIFFSSKGAGGEEELSTDPFSCSEQVKTKPCWSSLRGYYSRPRKYFGLYLFKKKKKVPVFQQVRDW